MNIDIIMKGFMKKILVFEVDKPSTISIKTSNAVKYIESDIQNIEIPRKYDPIIYYV